MGFWSVAGSLAKSLGQSVIESAKRHQKELEEMEQKAERGNTDAMYKWGRIYLHSSDEEKKERALGLLKRAAKMKHAPSIAVLEKYGIKKA